MTLFTKMTCHLPPKLKPPPPPYHNPLLLPVHLSADLSSTSLLCSFPLLALLIDRAEEMKYSGREGSGFNLYFGSFLFLLIGKQWVTSAANFLFFFFNNRPFCTHFPAEFCLLVDVTTTYVIIFYMDLRTRARCFIICFLQFEMSKLLFHCISLIR